MAGSEEELKSLLMSVKEELKSWPETQHSKSEDHAIWPHHFTAYRRGKNGTVTDVIFLDPKSLQTVIAATKLKNTCSLEDKL